MTAPLSLDALAAALHAVPVVPILTVDSEEAAVGAARALVAGGLPLIEVTLRTPEALAAIAAIAREVPDATVGAGTLITEEQIAEARSAGARFGISPGLTPVLMQAALEAGFAFLPGVSTVSECLRAGEAGYRVLKFFPAAASGGIEWLRSVAAPLPGIRFCPTGGIDARTAPGYLALPNVVTVGGSWVAPRELLRDGDWAGIEALARAAHSLRRANAQ